MYKINDILIHITFSLTVYSPLPPNKPNPTNRILLSTEKRIASIECPEYPQPPPKPKKYLDI